MAQSMRQTKPIQKQKRSANPPTIHRFAFFFIADLLSHGIHFEISLGRNAKGIGDTIEEGEHCCDVHSLGDLRLAPAVIAEKLHVFGSSSIGRLGHLGDIVEKGSFGWSDLRLIELSFRNGLYCFFVCSLNPQEVCMRVESIGAAIEPRDPAGDGFLGAAGEVTFRKVDCVAEAHYIAQEIRPMAETLEDSGHLLTSGVCAPLVVDLCDIAFRVRIFNDVDFCFRIGHSTCCQALMQRED
jgi:hypothetical protein